MPSIRRSLIAYFLLLLGVALGSVGFLVDQFAGEAIRAREDAEIHRAVQEYDKQCEASKEKFDADLLHEAQVLARDVRQKYAILMSWDSHETEIRKFRASMGVIPLGESLTGWSSLVSFAALRTESVRGTAFWAYFSPPQLDARVRKTFVEDEHAGWYEIRLPWTHQLITALRLPFKFPRCSPKLDADPILDHEFGTFTDETEGNIRRVSFRTTLFPPRTRGGIPRFSPGPPKEFHSNVPIESFFSLTIQYAKRQSELDDVLQEHKKSLDAEKERLTLATQESISWLRIRLALIGIWTFAALGIGGWLLVGRGLAPVRHLSHAVSQVSEKDFRLPIAREEMSHELLTIHDRLTQTLSALGHAFEREKRAIADISHELRTPLASLITTIEVSLRKPREADTYRTTLVECRDIGKQLTRLVERILILARMDAGDIKNRPELVDLSDIAGDCEIVIRPLAKEREIALTMNANPGAFVYADPNQVREVLMNLLHNAVEYSRPSGKIELKVSMDSAGVVCEVRDTGIGMTPETKSRIFERFFRADASRHTTGIHAGLGLAIVKEYVERMNGTIDVESTLGVGTLFRVHIPAPPEESEPKNDPVESAVGE